MAPKIAALATILATIVVAMTPAATDAMSTEQQQQQQQQHLRKLSRDSNELVHQGNGAFVDGTETIYDDFSLAWRFLGFYTDCNVCVDGDDDDEGDGGDEEFRDTAECIQDGADNTVCRRFALWAAYVDEGYEGNGKNEYQFYDRQHKRWNDSQCNDDDSRCVKLDCHDPYSKNFKLIGVYKDHKIGNFLENMIDHSGDCVWNDNEYKFMQAMNNNNNNNNNNNADYWPPTKCRAFKNGHGYYDAIPSEGGNLELEIFNDASCTVPYEIDNSSGFTPEQKLGRTKGDLDSWNAAMDAFKICQPCVSYDTIFLNSINNKKHGYNAHGDRYGDQGDDDAAGGDYFVCNNNLQQDEPTNQCKVFMEEGQDSMSKATYRDILLAESQGGITGIDLSSSSGRRGKHVVGDPFVKPSHKGLSILLLLLSMGFFGIALSQLFEKDRSKNSNNTKNMNVPLVGGGSTHGRSNKQNKNSSKSVVTTAAVASNSSRKSKEQRSAEKEQKKAQKPKKKSILRKKSKYGDDDDGASHDSTHYSKFQL